MTNGKSYCYVSLLNRICSVQCADALLIPPVSLMPWRSYESRNYISSGCAHWPEHLQLQLQLLAADRHRPGRPRIAAGSAGCQWESKEGKYNIINRKYPS